VKILLTGATGFIGQHALRALARVPGEIVAVAHETKPDAPYAGVRWVRADLRSGRACTALIQRERPTHLLHLAWRPIHGDVADSRDNLTWLKSSIDLGTAFADAGGSRLVASGSCFEYDWTDGVCTEGVTPLTPTTLYGAAKNALRAALAGLAQQAQFSFAWPRVFFAYGPGEHSSRFVASLGRAMLRGDPAEMTAGGQLRDFLYAGDIGESLARFLRSPAEGEFNVGSGAAVPLRDIAHKLAAQIGRPDLLRLGVREPREFEPPLIVANMDKTAAALRWRPQTTLQQGLAETIDSWRVAPDNRTRAG
jgi:nucleoside-diphosphate-sugar epimerase